MENKHVLLFVLFVVLTPPSACPLFLSFSKCTFAACQPFPSLQTCSWPYWPQENWPMHQALPCGQAPAHMVPLTSHVPPTPPHAWLLQPQQPHGASRDHTATIQFIVSALMFGGIGGGWGQRDHKPGVQGEGTEQQLSSPFSWRHSLYIIE